MLHGETFGVPMPDEQTMARSPQQHNQAQVGEAPNKATGSRPDSGLIAFELASEVQELTLLAADLRARGRRDGEGTQAHRE
jgi:hypothetical protein